MNSGAPSARVTSTLDHHPIHRVTTVEVPRDVCRCYRTPRPPRISSDLGRPLARLSTSPHYTFVLPPCCSGVLSVPWVSHSSLTLRTPTPHPDTTAQRIGSTYFTRRQRPPDAKVREPAHPGWTKPSVLVCTSPPRLPPPGSVGWFLTRPSLRTPAPWDPATVAQRIGAQRHPTPR
jgi:hypothetical protein